MAYLYQLPVPAIVLSQPRRNSPLEDSARVCRCSRAVLLHQLVTTNAGSFIPRSSFLHISVSHFNPSPNRARIILCSSGDPKVPSRRHLLRASLLAPSPCPLPFPSQIVLNCYNLYHIQSLTLLSEQYSLVCRSSSSSPKLLLTDVYQRMFWLLCEAYQFRS